jgi:hypothetical protein
MVTDVLATHTSKKNQIAIHTLAAALNGLTGAPGTGPLDLASLGMCVVLALARTAHHMASSDTAAAKHVKSCPTGHTSQIRAFVGKFGSYTCH